MQTINRKPVNNPASDNRMQLTSIISGAYDTMRAMLNFLNQHNEVVGLIDRDKVEVISDYRTTQLGSLHQTLNKSIHKLEAELPFLKHVADKDLCPLVEIKSPATNEDYVDLLAAGEHLKQVVLLMVSSMEIGDGVVVNSSVAELIKENLATQYAEIGNSNIYATPNQKTVARDVLYIAIAACDEIKRYKFGRMPPSASGIKQLYRDKFSEIKVSDVIFSAYLDTRSTVRATPKI